MNLLSGLEQFGFKVDSKKNDLFADDKKDKKEKVSIMQEPELTETDFIYDKHIRCTVCQKVINVKIVKNARLKRLQPDFDLRPRFQYIDSLKYDVYSCPYCGYSAMPRYFEHITRGQINLIKEHVCSSFQPTIAQENVETYDYETAITRYKLALLNTIAKKGKASEKAYTCLKISWLYRDWIKEMPDNTEEEQKTKQEAVSIQEEFYKEAFEGFQKAISSEDFPMCGMDSFTMDYLLACMAYHFKDFSLASRYVSNILGSQLVEQRIKNRALDLKELIIKEIRDNNK